MLKRKVETCPYDLRIMVVRLLFHIASQLQCLVLYGDYTDLQGHSQASKVRERVAGDFT